MTAAAAIPPPDAPLPCLRCTYDLRGLPATSPCPECGLAISLTLSPRDHLHDCPPQWVRRIVLGTDLLTLSTLPLLLSAVLFALLTLPLGLPHIDPAIFYTKQVGTPTPTWTDRLLAYLFTPNLGPSALFFLALLLQLPAVFLLTSREPGTRRDPHRWQTRAWRALTLLALLSVPLDRYAPSVPFGTWQQWSVFAAIWLTRSAFVPCPALAFCRLRRLTTRLGRPRLAEHAAIVGAGLSAFLLIFSVRDLHGPGDNAPLRWLEYYQPFVTYWWPFQHIDALLLSVPPSLLALTYFARRLTHRRPSLTAYAWAIALSLAATTWGLALADGHFTRALWKTLLVAALPLTTGLTFTLWALLVLTRAAFQLSAAALAARDTWRRADAAVTQ